LLAGYDERRADYRKINASFGEVPLDWKLGFWKV
jgi:acyl-CoA hydrolase